MSLDSISNFRNLRKERSDWLLTVLTGVLLLLIFVFAPLQAVGITAFHLFAIGLLLVIIGSMVIISDSPIARLTTTFETEAEAKHFARAKLLEGLIVFAGTINPYLPRQLIFSNRVAAWAAGEQDE